MRVKDLIATLQELDGELEVYGYCDHGQSAERVSPPSIIFTEHEGYTLWDEYVEDEDIAEECGYTVKAVLL